MAKKVILIVSIILVSGVIIYQGFLKKEKPTFTLFEVIKGNIVEEISETGQVQKGQKINLSFKTSGRLEKIYVEVGEEVKKGDILAKIDTGDLIIQLNEAKSSLAVAEAKLAKLLAGSTKEEIQVSQTKVENSEITLETTKQNLEDTYEDALNIFDDAYLKAYNSQNTVGAIQRTYFISNDQAGIRVKENKEKIEAAVSQIKSSLDTTKANPTHENIELALSQIKDKLSQISVYLKTIREACEEPTYQNLVSSTDKSSLDTQRLNILTLLTNVTDSQQSITTGKLSINSAEGQLKSAKDNLALVTALPLEADINLYQAQVRQAESQVQLLENQIREANLRSPIDGEIVEIKKRVGEIVQPLLQDFVMTILPAGPFEIETNIYEEDIVKVDIDNPVAISLVALPEKIFKGKVISIDPAEKIIEGVVYYKVIVAFDTSTSSVSTLSEAEWVAEIPEGLRPGMTADLIIKSAVKENVLIIPKDALLKKNGKLIVEVLENGKIEEKEIETGLEGKDDKVEVIFGLVEGEKVIVR